MGGTVVLREKWPVIGRHGQATTWLQIWTDLGRAPRTIDAYARGLAEYLLMCEREGVDPVTANRAHVAVFVRERLRLPRLPGVAALAWRFHVPVLRLRRGLAAWRWPVCVRRLSRARLGDGGHHEVGDVSKKPRSGHVGQPGDSVTEKHCGEQYHDHRPDQPRVADQPVPHVPQKPRSPVP